MGGCLVTYPIARTKFARNAMGTRRNKEGPTIVGGCLMTYPIARTKFDGNAMGTQWNKEGPTRFNPYEPAVGFGKEAA